MQEYPDPTVGHPVIDLNCDLGEGFGAWSMGDDRAMLDLVTSANVACGFHAGDPIGILRVVEAAAERGVAIGAHVAYRDLQGFGRRALDVATDDLIADVLYQIGALDGLARSCGTSVRYVKPHGALYHALTADRRQATAVVEAVRRYPAELPLVLEPRSPAEEIAAGAGVPTVLEGFVDRGYRADGTLVRRDRPGALVHDPEVAARRALALVAGDIDSVDGGRVTLDVATLCVHGDTPGAVQLASAVRSALLEAEVALRAFVHG